MKKIFFVSHGIPEFAKKDICILNSKYKVRTLNYSGHRNILSILFGVFSNDLVFCWFGSIHAFYAIFFAGLLRKKSIVIAGGYDVGQEDGLWNNPMKKWCPKYVFEHADKIIAVSEFNKREAITNLNIEEKSIDLIYHGFDDELYCPDSGQKKVRTILTVSRICKHNLKRKGLDLFVEASRLLPEYKFVLAGEWYDDTVKNLNARSKGNVVFTGKISMDELINYYKNSMVYVQASVHEAFGCSLAEAMLCECVPVVSRVAALPEVAGDCAIYVETKDPQELANKIKLALCRPELGKLARQRIINNFSLNKRQILLLNTVDNLIEKKIHRPILIESGSKLKLFDGAKCPICRTSRLKMVGIPQISINLRNFVKNDHYVFKCNDCCFYFVYPQIVFNRQTWEKFYNAEYFEDNSRISIWLRKKDRKKRLNRLSRYKNNEKINFLDIGCGKGEVIVDAQKRNWNVYGLDISDNRNAFAKMMGISFILGDIFQAKFKDDYFDCIYMDSVLEHVDDPLGYLKEINKIMKKGGVLYIGVPNEDSLFNGIKKILYYIFGKKKISPNLKPFATPYHINGFTKNSLRIVARDSKFEILQLRDFAGQFDFLKFKAFTKPFIINVILLPIHILAIFIRKQIYLEVILRK